jgi:hypothetical protein
MLDDLQEMNEIQEKVFFRILMLGTLFFFALGLTIVVTFFTDHYLSLALPIVERIYGTQESIPLAYDRGLRLCILSAFAVTAGLGSMALLRMRRKHKLDCITNRADEA